MLKKIIFNSKYTEKPLQQEDKEAIVQVILTNLKKLHKFIWISETLT